MSQQGEKPAAGDDWWHRLYDESAPDTGPASAAGDTLDDRFDSAADTVGAPPPPDEGPGTWWDPSPLQGGAPPRPDGAPPAGGGPVAATPSTTPRAAHPFPEAGSPAAGAGVPPAAGASSGAGTGAGGRPRLTGPEPGDAGAGRPAVSGAEPKPAGPAAGRPPQGVAVPRPRAGYVGDRPPTYDAEPTALPVARPQELEELVADTVLDGARYGTFTLRAASVRGDSARYRGEHRRDALLTARFGAGEGALVMVAVATGARATESAHLAAADACRWIAGAVGRSHARLADDIRGGRRGDLKSGLHRLTDRSFGKLRARATELGLSPETYTANLRCLLLSADPACRTRVFFGVGAGGLFRLRDGGWQDIEPPVPDSAAGEPVVGYGSPPTESSGGDRLTMDLGITTAPAPHIDPPVPPPVEPFRFRASVARPGDTLLLCSTGLAEPLRGEPALAGELAQRWAGAEPPGLAAYLADTQLRVKGYADDRTACAVWEA
ncbi:MULTISPECIES: protein phosphatase 2C domain-containing protein [Streptomyces]|uniref:Protein phosphatase 2C domain-containing protein n=1 Tax=Streptomyces pratisoli TaxID=3139917 RepID=A0ACC6QPX8_9ACTN|nr:protein phosphatase 2C domain-containing protein [Streptomyces sp. NBC_00259]